MGTAIAMPRASSVPAGPVLRAVERACDARGMSRRALSRQYAEEHHVSDDALLRIYQRGSVTGRLRNTTADQVLAFLGAAPIGEVATGRICTECGFTLLRSTNPDDVCDPCQTKALYPWTA